MKMTKEAIFHLIYVMLLGVLVGYVIMIFEMDSHRDSEDFLDFSKGWELQDGKHADACDIRAKAGQGSVVMAHALPEKLGDDVSLCFVSHNTKFRILLDDREIYAFDSGENLTGYGYGKSSHVVRLTSGDAGKILTMEFASVFQKSGSGYMEDIRIGNSKIYLYDKIQSTAIPTVLSGFILFFGVLFVAIYLFASNKSAFPYNIAALGCAAILLGIWCLGKTDFLQLITGKSTVFRVFDYLAIFLAEYPVFCFVHSFTQQRKQIYRGLFFGMWLFFGAVVLVLRFALHMDMHNFVCVFQASYLGAISFLVYMLKADGQYCLAHGIKRDSGHFVHGAVLFVIGAFLEVFAYVSDERIFASNGSFIRLGLCCFIFEMSLQFLSWWSGERILQKRTGFINDVLKFAVASEDPEKNIYDMLAYLGEKFQVDHAYISEIKGEKQSDTYQWYRKGISEKCEIRNSVSEPLEADGKRLGILGFENVPETPGRNQNTEEITKIINLITYFFSQLLKQRDNNRELISFGFQDKMTGVGNRRAFEKFEETELDPKGTFGYIMCDVNGLKNINDTQGHEAGDALIRDITDSLVSVFGKQNVYRLGGDEFTAFSRAENRGEMDRQIKTVIETMTAKGRSASIGAIFCQCGDIPYEEVKRRADQLMYAEKEKYYSGRNDRRSRHE